jgi:asparagine synthase (glutamine-hydrolysing)
MSGRVGRFLTKVKRRLRGTPPVVEKVRDEKLTFLERHALTDLHEEVARLERECRDGVLIEAGAALGGSAIVIGTAKSRERPLYVYDVFGMIPEPSERDDPDVHERYDVIASGQAEGIDGETYYGYREDLLGDVTRSFERHGLPPSETNVHLVKGLYEDTLEVNEPVALAHLDCDWYDSVITCLERIEPRLVPGGVLVIDDYYGWSGARKAIDDYFADRRGDYEFVDRFRLHIRRLSG